MVYEFAMSLSRGKESQVFAVSLTISTGTCSRQRATVRRYRTLTRHLVYPANRRDRGLSAYEVLPLWADVPARPAYRCSPTRLQRVIGGDLALCMFDFGSPRNNAVISITAAIGGRPDIREVKRKPTRLTQTRHPLRPIG